MPVSEGNKSIDLRSDAMSLQSPQMCKVAERMVADQDMSMDDAALGELEAYAADMCGMEAAILFPTGVMANLAAVWTHTPRSAAVITGRLSHIFNHEGGGVSVLGGIPMQTIDDSNGIPNPDELDNAISHGEFYSAKTGLICIENSHNDSGGRPIPPEQVASIKAIADRHAIPVHMDGARIFNTCVRLGLNVKAFTGLVDSLMFCLSKGLGAPFGALLLGKRSFIESARNMRQLLGGGISLPKQYSAVALTALQSGMDQLAIDNDNAARFARTVATNQQLAIPNTESLTNVVYVHLNDKSVDAREFVPRLESSGVQILANKHAYRAVFHNGVNERDADYAAAQFNSLF